MMQLLFFGQSVVIVVFYLTKKTTIFPDPILLNRNLTGDHY